MRTIPAAFAKKFKKEMNKYGGRLSNKDITPHRRKLAEQGVAKLMKIRMCDHDWKLSFTKPGVNFYRCMNCKFTVAC